MNMIKKRLKRLISADETALHEMASRIEQLERANKSGDIPCRLDWLEHTYKTDAAKTKEVTHGAELLQQIIFQDTPDPAEQKNMQFFDRLYKNYGSLKSSADFSAQTKLMTELYFAHREKSEIAFTVGSSWYKGDYFEFGSHDLDTFRNMLTAYNVCTLSRQYEDVRFYAFDIFGDPTVNAPRPEAGVPSENFVSYFSAYLAQGNQIKRHEEFLDQHKLYRDKCFLVQGLFQNTLTEEFKAKYKSENRKISFAFLDCNMASSYKLVFEFIFDLMGEESHIYMDEYFQNPTVTEYYQEFVDRLRKERNIGSVYIRNAGGFGGLFRLYPIGITDEKYNLRQ